MKNFVRICIIAISTAIFRYILIEKIGLDIKQTYDFFYLFISTGTFAGIINLFFEDTYMLFSSGNGLPPVAGGAGINAGSVNPAAGQANPPIAGQANPPAANPAIGQANLPAWGDPNQPKIDKNTGPIIVNDPNGQNYVYNQHGTNQPLLGYMASALDNQYNKGLKGLSRYVFSSQQRQFLLDFLYHNDRELYNKMTNYGRNTNPPAWWQQENTKKFRDLLRNAN